jgi:hypothetical protein
MAIDCLPPFVRTFIRAANPVPATLARISARLAWPETVPQTRCIASAQEPDSKPPAETTLLVMSSLNLPLEQCRFCSITLPFALTALADLQPSRSIGPSAVVTVPVPDHFPDNPRNGPAGPASAYPCAGANTANAVNTPHRATTGFKQGFAVDFAFQIACVYHAYHLRLLRCIVPHGLAEHGFLMRKSKPEGVAPGLDVACLTTMKE